MSRWTTACAFVLAVTATVCGCGRAAERDWPSTKQQVREAFPDVRQLTTQELADWLASDRPRPVLLDARTPEEFAVSHLDGAISTPDVDQAITALEGEDPTTPVVVYCSVGYRSSALAEQLTQRNYDNVMNLEGSIFEWANAGRPVVRDDQPVEVVHPYNEDWGQLLNRRLWENEPRP